MLWRLRRRQRVYRVAASCSSLRSAFSSSSALSAVSEAERKRTTCDSSRATFAAIVVMSCEKGSFDYFNDAFDYYNRLNPEIAVPVYRYEKLCHYRYTKKSRKEGKSYNFSHQKYGFCQSNICVLVFTCGGASKSRCDAFSESTNLGPGPLREAYSYLLSHCKKQECIQRIHHICMLQEYIDLYTLFRHKYDVSGQIIVPPSVSSQKIVSYYKIVFEGDCFTALN